MPGMDGFNASREIRLFNKKVVIIAQTAYGSNVEKDKAMAAGCNDYIEKPINASDLTDIIRKHFKYNQP